MPSLAQLAVQMQPIRVKKAIAQSSCMPTLDSRWSSQRPLLLVLVLQPCRPIRERFCIDPILDLFEQRHLNHVLNARAHDDHLNALELGRTGRRFLDDFGNISDKSILNASFHGV